jgi:hypothetical protein
MTIPQRNSRGLPDISTFGASAGRFAVPHKAYLRVACLEMEKFRRGKEKESAARRIQNIDTRFREIDAEEAALLEGLKGPGAGAVTAGARSGSAGPPASSGSMTRVLRLKY